MKRVLTFLAIMLLPLSVWAMTPVTDSDLSNVTGQAGVNINADLTMDINIGTMAWGDADGVTGPYDPWTTVGTGGYVGMTGFNIHNLVIRARTDTADNYNTYSTLMLKPITIDVATGDKSAQGGSATATFVRFGLGALKISMDQLQFNVALGARPGAGADLVLDQVMGVVTMGAMSMYINPTSYVDIFAHGAMGVSFDVNVTLDRLTMNYMSWGDTDGLGAGVSTYAGQTGKTWMSGTTAGYIGMNNFNLGDAMHPAVTMNGTVAIDVATSHEGVYAKLPKLANAINMAIMGAGFNYHDFAVGAKGLYYGTRMSYLVGTLSMAPSAAIAVLQAGALGGSPFCVPMDSAFAGAATGVFSALAVSQAPGYDEPVTVVHISFPGSVGTMADAGVCGFKVNVAKITADIALGDTAGFTVGGTSTSPMPAVLGDIYIQGMEMKIKQGSWVDIWAH